MSPRPKSLIYCFSVSVECQFLKLPEVLDLSRVGLITVLKSPPITIVEFDRLASDGKKSEKMRDCQCLDRKY